MNIYIAFGSNQALGRRTPRTLLCEAAETLETCGVRLVARSSLWQSPAWPDPADPAYVNAVAQVETRLTPTELLLCLHEVEEQFGRVRSQRNAPRTLDLDIVDFGGLVSDGGEGPVLPHPRADQRAFVLLPLQEIAPGWKHPVTGNAISRLIDALPPGDIHATTQLGPFVRGG